MTPGAPLSDAEREVLTVLWETGPATSRRIRVGLEKKGRDWAPTTVGTLLTRLENKKYVQVDKSEFVHVFKASVSRESVVSQRLREVAEAYCDGRSTPLILALVETQRFTDEEIQQFRDLVDRLDKNKAGKSKSASRRKRK